jgi:hypothetical protein
MEEEVRGVVTMGTKGQRDGGVRPAVARVARCSDVSNTEKMSLGLELLW